MRISDWSSDVCSSDLFARHERNSRRRRFKARCLVARTGLTNLQPESATSAPMIGRFLGLAVAITAVSVGVASIASRSAGDDVGAPATAETQDNSNWTRSEEHTSELQSLMRSSYAVLCLKKKTQ